MARYHISIIACARWETPYITEWLLYHRAIGFDHVYLCCNDDDPTDLYREVLPFLESSASFVTFWHVPYQGQQFHIYMGALSRWVGDSDWIMFLDIDEFLRIEGSNSIQKFVSQVPPEWDSIYFNWLFFGNNGHRTRPAGSVLQTYTRRAALAHITCKTLTRTRAIELARIDRRVFFWHDWEGCLKESATIRNVLGMDSAEVARDGHHVSQDIHDRLLSRAVIHHYAFKSRDDFKIRIARGISGDFSGQVVWKNIDDAGGADIELAHLNEVLDARLADIWSNYLAVGALSRSCPPPVTLPNLARDGHANQSSVGEWSHAKTTEADASGAISGHITGFYQQHTGVENRPWWQVDLGTVARVHEVRVFNRMDSPGVRVRLRNFAVEISPDGITWSRAAVYAGADAVGGIDGSPYRLVAREPFPARLVRIQLLEHGCLHLDQVEVYGDTGQ